MPGRLWLLVPLAFLPLGSFLVDSSVPVFENVTSAAGVHFRHISGQPLVKDYIFEAKGGGVGFFDFDNDGWLDIWIVQGSTLENLRQGRNPHGALFRNKKDGTFEDVTDGAGLTRGAWGMGVTVGDYDNDGFADLYLTNFGPNFLYRNNGDGTFRDVTERSGLGDDRWSSSAAFGDYDLDGDLDLYVCNYISLDVNDLPKPGSRGYCYYKGEPVMCGPRGLPGSADALYRNNGDGTFTDVTDEAGVTDDRGLYGLGVVWADMDNDGDPDLYVANDDGPNLFYVNRGDGSFDELGLSSGLAVSLDGRNQGSMGVDVADYDNDGRMDVFLTHFASDYNTLYHQRGDLLFEDVTGQTELLEKTWHLVSWGTRFVDLNHDGLKDLVFVNGHVTPFLNGHGGPEKYFQPISVYMNRGGNHFVDVGSQVGSSIQEGRAGRGAAFGDFDNDGDIDFLVANLNETPSLFRLERRDENHWLMFRVRGRSSNRDGIGARISATVGEQTQIWEIKRAVSIYSASDPRAHFGLGRSGKAEVVTVLWPGGKVQEFKNVDADIHYLIDEEEGLMPEFHRNQVH